MRAKCGVMPHVVMGWDGMGWDALRYGAIRYNSMQCNAMRCDAIRTYRNHSKSLIKCKRNLSNLIKSKPPNFNDVKKHASRHCTLYGYGHQG
eukprot:scaffold4569_cov22-Prasinocladus_malaysianus.AAC.2